MHVAATAADSAKDEQRIDRVLLGFRVQGGFTVSTTPNSRPTFTGFLCPKPNLQAS